MGAGNSTGNSKKSTAISPSSKQSQRERRKAAQEAERGRYMDKKSIEQFVINVYATCPRIESMWLILSNIMGQKAFGNFVSSEKADEYFQLFMRISTLNSTNNPSFYVLKMRMKTVIDEFFGEEAENRITLSPFLEKVVLEIKALDPESKDFHLSMFTCMESIQNEMVYLMAKEQFNRFIISKQYKQWRASESSHAAAATASQFSDKDIPNEETRAVQVTKNTPSFKKEARLKNSKIVAPVDLSYSAFANVDHRSIGEILGTESWLATLVAAVEGLPVCFSLAKVKDETKLKPMEKNFPLVYVNKYFTKITGFPSSQVLGRPCKDFLQCAESDKEEIKKMAAGLREMKPTIARLKNVTKAEVVFMNMVALKPIFDNKGNPVFVVGIHFDITKEHDGGVGKNNLAEELMACIPTVLKIKEEEEEEDEEEEASMSKSGEVEVKARMSNCVIS